MYTWGFLMVAVAALVVAGFFAPVLWIAAGVLLALGLIAGLWSTKHAAEDTSPPPR